MGCGIPFPFVVSRATDYINAAAQLTAASASKRRQQQAKPVLALARCAERSVLRQGWNVKCPVDMWSRRMAFANHKVPCMRDA